MDNKNENNKLQESGEMYLETILILQSKLSGVRSIDIVEYMGYTKPSVSRAVNLLKTSGYITVDNAGFISFTNKGKEKAESVYERHVLLSEFLKSIGVSETTAVADACKIEHYISEETFDAIKAHAKSTR